jgi:acyl-CoA thioester hydrolase
VSAVPDIPAPEDVGRLPLLRELTVPAEYEDLNGHMRITHHLGIHDDAGWAFLTLIGIDERYLSEQRRGLVDLENHLRYLAEVHVGERVAVHVRVLARSAKTVHTVWFLVNRSNGRLANTLEAVSAHFDLEARCVTPFPDDVAGVLDRLIEEHQALSWPAPVCGFMGVRP